LNLVAKKRMKTVVIVTNLVNWPVLSNQIWSLRRISKENSSFLMFI
jgi:hypothetical protein